MATANFHDRIARLHAKYDANPIPKVEMAPHIEDVEAQRAKTAKRTQKLRRLLAFAAFFAGVAMPIVAKLAVFHFTKNAPPGGATEVFLSLLGATGAGLLLAGCLSLVLLVRKRYVAFLLFATGAYLALWHEGDLMRVFPEVWAMLYNQAYVTDTLSSAR